jgi:glutamine amidotransferase
MIAIVKYNAGNTCSVQNALLRLGYEAVITDDENLLRNADKVIFPGVGEASTAMSYLRERGLDQVIISLKQPVLGICLGLQLMCKHSEEGDVNCLGIFDNKVKKFPDLEIVPHMGWNNFTTVKGMLMKHIEAQNDVYYVHNYFADLSDDTTAICNYINPFSAVLEKDNFFATQFHPEKSADVGEQILKNFLKL